jgi:hypothetical protein
MSSVVAVLRLNKDSSKGDPTTFENYRPYSWFNSMCEIFAAIVQNRLAEELDPYLQRTQVGFRKHKSTVQAIHCVRRIAEVGEITGKQTLLVGLDWEKAFDKVTRPRLFSALERMNVPGKLLGVIKALCRDPTFK